MKLSDWLKTKKMTRTELAGRLGVSVSIVSRWTTGERAPSLRYMKVIHEITGGKVGLKDWQPPERDGAADCGAQNATRPAGRSN